ncbi:MAG: hypothetical protein AABO57_09775 [Acidobacteriota bacterium]
MAVSKSFLIVEEYIRAEWLHRKYGQVFTKKIAPLRNNGFFAFDAVSNDGQIVGCISANSGRAKKGGFAKSKMRKIHSDIMFLILSEAPQKLMILADKDIYDYSMSEQQRGRLPQEIELCLADLSDSMTALLSEAQEAASREISVKLAEITSSL